MINTVSIARIFMLFILIIALNACGNDTDWYEASSEETEIIKDFINVYKDSWTESLENENFSVMDSYFIVNSTIWHTERRQHRRLMGERKIEELSSFNEFSVDTNEYGEYRANVSEEIIEVTSSGEIEVERKRVYFIVEEDELILTDIRTPKE